jgi:hypothetical protein
MIDVDKIPTEEVTIEFIDKMLNEKEVLRTKDVKKYIGIFTGKWVKPWEKDLESMKEFKKGNPVIVESLEDYIKFHDGLELIVKGMERILGKY